jgi:hypothetical protein
MMTSLSNCSESPIELVKKHALRRGHLRCFQSDHWRWESARTTSHLAKAASLKMPRSSIWSLTGKDCESHIANFLKIRKERLDLPEQGGIHIAERCLFRWKSAGSSIPVQNAHLNYSP